MNPETLISAFGERELLIGLVLGLVAGIAALVHRRGSLWILSVGVAAIVGLLIGREFDDLPEPSAGLVAGAALAVIVGAIGVWLVSRDVGNWTVAICLAITALGVWGTVPDTELAMVLLGAVVGGLVGAIRVGPEAIGPIWPVPLLGVAAFVALVEGLARDSAPIGALATFGVFLLFPLIFGLFESAPSWLVIGAHVVLVIVTGRIAGTASSALAAIVIALLAHVAVGVGLVLVARRGSNGS